MKISLRRLVRKRASRCCEYCLIHEDDALLPHEPDHIISEKHGGQTTPENLALACFYCNRYKGSDIASIDPVTGALTLLFNPRTQVWDEHFRLEGGRIIPLTAEGRVTERILQLNHPNRLFERQILRDAGIYPPKKVRT
ncbi:HNH endonuclease [Candidatus Poribacteria bacterium]|nr:HNH endonuclease [Candidatus Poribacteria bacterium]